MAKEKLPDTDILQSQRETFVASLSHDLKNPTIAQIRALELILNGKFGNIAPKQREVMEMVLDSCRYMKAMLGNILVTYQSENGTINLETEEFSLTKLAKECTDEMIYLAKEKDVDITFKDSTDNDLMFGDRVQLKRVIMNLLSNGIKYAYPKTDMLIEVYNEKKYICFKFQNISPYLPPNKTKTIFARYISLSDGIGLGLYASKKIVEALDGKIFVESNKNEENTFGFKIPNKKKFKNKKRTVTF